MSDPAPEKPGTAPRKPGTLRLMADNRWAVLALLFFVTGVLGLPVLVASRAFTPAQKMLVALLNTAWTAALVWGVWQICAWSWGQVSPAL